MRMFAGFLSLLSLIFVSSSCVSSGGKPPFSSPIEADAAVFNVSATSIENGPRGPQEITFYGTGFGISKKNSSKENRCIATSGHLVRMSGKQEFQIRGHSRIYSARVVADLPDFDLAILMAGQAVSAIALPLTDTAPLLDTPLMIISRDTLGDLKRVQGRMGSSEMVPIDILGRMIWAHFMSMEVEKGQSGSPVFSPVTLENGVTIGYVIAALPPSYTFFVPMSLEVLAAWAPEVAAGCGLY